MSVSIVGEGEDRHMGHESGVEVRKLSAKTMYLLVVILLT
jgi:hypothetical protein